MSVLESSICLPCSLHEQFVFILFGACVRFQIAFVNILVHVGFIELQSVPDQSDLPHLKTTADMYLADRPSKA